MTEKHTRLEYRLDSRANQRGHWGKKARLVAADRQAGDVMCWHYLRANGQQVFPCAITLTRIAPRSLDDDNLVSCFKGIRDSIAARLGLKSDRDPRVTWRYAQTSGKPKYYAIQMTVVDCGMNDGSLQQHTSSTSSTT